MKKPLLVLLILLAAITSKAQNTQKDSIYVTIENPPEFKKGDFLTFAAQNILYPASAVKDHIQGKVFVQFIIQKDGKLSDAKIVRSVSPDIDAEALRVVNSSPPWKPGIQNGRPVPVSFTIPITFRLNLPAQKVDSSVLLKTNTSSNDTTIYKKTDVEPEFPGGLMRFFTGYIRNNEKSKNNEGTVRVAFVIEKDGSLTNIRITQSLSESADKEVIRLITQSPKWAPAMQNGKPVRVQFSCPIYFPAR
ncbi:TonB family C-terminal domain-containing protein [Mucilaginibacter mallensis]|uniref:TonB family C-terminal domain-containing protein n=1 Tax=Mucilaginibacter mallensis TaxID=652787 RepID=A0A1H1YWX0_MUCMA|nr:energy transducer TonB [Mucilaginibacter mallensis]SDT25893.1 TonB family C-terminal domain-containing protein [Mucilaginibacter mallensis]